MTKAFYFDFVFKQQKKEALLHFLHSSILNYVFPNKKKEG
jgi:hypothetical protein